MWNVQKECRFVLSGQKTLEIGRNLRMEFAEGEGIWSTSKKRNKFHINAALTGNTGLLCGLYISASCQ